MYRRWPKKYKKGDWKAACDFCGQTYYASQLKENWQGYMLCPSDWEPRHPQEFVRGIPDDPSPPWTRPKGTPEYAADTTQTVIENGKTYIVLEDGSKVLVD